MNSVNNGLLKSELGRKKNREKSKIKLVLLNTLVFTVPMSSYNRVTLMGNLTRNPELRKTKTGTSVTELGLALNRVWSGENGEKQEDVTFVDVTLWGRNAENAAQYLQKGRAVLIEGRLQLETWQDKQSGQDRSKLKVVADAIQFLGGGQESGNSHSHSDHSEGREKDNRDERVEILEENDRGARRQSLPPAPSERSYPNGSPDRRDSEYRDRNRPEITSAPDNSVSQRSEDRRRQRGHPAA